MVKIKAKKQANEASKSLKNNGLPIDAQKIGVAIAGVVVSELVNVAVQRLSSKALGTNQSAEDTEPDNESGNPLQQVAAQVGDRLGDAEASAKDAARAVRSSASNLTLNLSDVVDVLRDVGQQLKHQSANAINASSEAVLGNVSDRATAVLDRVSPDSRSDSGTRSNSGKRHKKKKAKKKKH